MGGGGGGGRGPFRKAAGLPRAQGLPGGVHVGVQVLLRRLARAGAVARVVVGEDVAVDPRAQADVEAAHLAQVHRVAVGEEQGELGVGRAAHEHAGDAAPPRRARHEALHGVPLARRVLPVGPLRQVQRPARAALVRDERVGGVRRQEGQLGGDLTGAGGAAEQAAQLAQGQVVHFLL